MPAPFVSVLIPSFNCARYLPEAIDSVLAQDLNDFELVILDDRSSDSSGDILEAYALRDKRIRYQLNERNLGLVENWNACLAAARGKYVKFLHSDDKLTRPSALRQFVDLIEAQPAATLVACGREIIDENSRRVRIKGFAGRRVTVPGAEAIALTVGTGSNLIGEPSCVLFRRSDARRGFDPGYRQLVDLDMWFHLLRAGELVYTPESLCAFRRHDSQQSNVNRISGGHSGELAELVAAYADTARQLDDPDSLTAWSYRLHRLERTAEVQAMQREIDARLGAARHWRRFAYALGRPMSNLSRRMRRYR
jgi:glycosyltransferase involved in cell wall biosynthesis